jgi:phenylpropionate dioxygenase-like ring-hydroxylating dioxygenase large terminal subunit
MPAYASLVDSVNGTIDRSIFVDATIFDEEQERIFTRAWLFVGHESQIPTAGDFFVSRMGTESVILTRDRGGAIHVFLNSCRHRGMKVCRYDEGNTALFTCPYHAWSYGTDGTLVGVPMFAELYEGRLRRSEWGLVEVAQLTNYRGTIWATWDASAPPLLDYLGEQRTYLDLLLDPMDGGDGPSEVLKGIQKWVVPSNWKFGAENFLGDVYHAPSHQSVNIVGIGPSARAGVKGRRDMAAAPKRFFTCFPGGHATYGEFSPDEHVPTFLDNPEVQEYFRHCFEERKRRRGDRAEIDVNTGTIFPNTSFQGKQPRAIFVFHPHGATSMEMWRFYLVDRDAPVAVKDALRRFYIRYAGPAGMTEQDDMENWNYATAASRGPIARRYPYNYQQSMNAWKRDDPVPGRVSLQPTEEIARNYYRAWADYMSGTASDRPCR